FAEHLVVNPGRPTFQLSKEAQKLNEWRNRPALQSADLVEPPPGPDEKPPPEPPPSQEFLPESAIVGYAIAHFHRKQADEFGQKQTCMLQPGDDVIITTISGVKLQPVYARFAVCDYFRSEMSEYDSNYVFVPLAYLQKLRTMEDRVTNIQIRL